MEDVLKAFCMFISICFGRCVRIFFGSNNCWGSTISILFSTTQCSSLLFFLTLFILIAFRYTSLTDLVCIERLLHWIRYSSILKSTIFGMGTFAWCYTSGMPRKVCLAYICIFWLPFRLFSDYPWWIQLDWAIGRPFWSVKFIFVNWLTSISCLNWWLKLSRAIFILRVLGHVNLVCKIIFKNVLTRLILVVTTYHILFLLTNLAWVYNNDVIISTLPSSCRLSQI